MPLQAEQRRLEGLYGRLRDRLLDLSSRNPLVSYKHRPTSKRQLRFVDAVPDLVYAQLVAEVASIQILPLTEPDEVPMDERTGDFISHLEHAKLADATYLTKVHELENAGADGEFELALAERALRDRIRADLNLPPRPLLRAINASHHAESLGIDPSFDLPGSQRKEIHKERSLQTLKWPDALEATLEKIADEARLAEQEMGLSTLYLVFGFLEWFEADASDKHYTAPLLLLPVKLEKKKTIGRKAIFNLSAAAEAPEINLSLKKRLERDFNRLLPDFAADEERHEAVEEYLAAVEKTIEGQKRWRVRRQLTLGHFAFGRLAMYAELDPDKWEKHPVQIDLVRSVLSGSEMDGGDGASQAFAPPEDYAIDDPEIEKIAPHLIHDADASQHSALIDVVSGKNLVIQGPPGTGKSQTITNVIANVIGNGGTVLFLAEKQAALEVVKRRMDKAELGEFCLELHSDRAASRRVIESLKARHAIGYGSKGQGSGGVGPGWREGRREIADYLTALHRPLKGGATPFAAIWKALRARSREQLQISRFGDVQLSEELLRDDAAQALLQSDLSLYSGMLQQYEQRFGMPASSPWWAIEFGENVSAGSSGAILEEFRSLRDLCDHVTARMHECSHWGATTSLQMARCVEAVGRLPERAPTQPMLDALRGIDRSAVRSLIGTLEELIALELQRGDLPRLDGAGAALLLAIEKVTELALTKNEAKLTAAALMQAAERSTNRFGRVLGDLQAVQPVLRMAGIENAARGTLLLALGLIVELFSRMPAEWQSWALRLDDEKAKRFEQLFGSWVELAEDEAGWRGRFPSFGDGPWPSPSELSHVAGLMRKSRFARLMGSLFGDRAAIDGLAARLAVPAVALPGPAELEAMACHVQALTAFEANRMHRQFLGALWSGLDTPFDGLRSVNHDMLNLIGRVLLVEGGGALLRRLRELGGSEFDGLISQHGLLARLAHLPADLNALLASHSIEEIVEGKSQADERVGRLMRADPDRLLPQISIPVEQLEQARQVELKRRELSAQIHGHELSSLLSMFTAPGGIEGAKVAMEWLDAAEADEASQGLREILVHSAAEIAPIRAAASAFANAEKQLRERLEHLIQQYGLRGLQPDNLDTLSTHLDALLGFGTQLKEVLELRDQRRRLAAAGIDKVVRRAEEVGVLPSDWCLLVGGLIASRQVQNVRRADAALRRVSGLRLEAQRKAFVEQDRGKIAHDRDTLRNAARAVTPPNGTRSGSRKTWTEMQLILNEFNKERKFVPVRDLIARAGKAMLAMKPCFMMSPLSLAKFLPPGSIEFDLLVIDEASQMRPEDALGGLLRVKQIVVVGDQKQLPPTDFFNRSGGDETSGMADEDFEDVDDESILEACQKTFSHSRMLRWHYRSRCESLIAFSNAMFYGNQLITFPMARPGSFSVELRKIAGAYEARRNPPEAEEIVTEAIAFMREHADDEDEGVGTIGIVAINTEQRDLISEEFRLRASRDERVERYREKAKARGEEFFIKNLENVQGDERDVILISLTYGPKPGQKTPHQRFGPINGKHGHRRLNVLFSRARDKIVLFTSLEAQQIVSNPGGHLGVHVLKKYLAYAEAGGQAVPEGVGDPADSDFEIEVRERLQQRGYTVDTQIGVSGYRIDLGVRNPDRPQSYLAGVECDGASYHASKSARDRDRLRQDCLKEKGWEIVRVWSTDWFDDPDGQTEKLVTQLEQLRVLAAERAQRETARCAERALAVAAMIAEEGASNAGGVNLEANPSAKVREETEVADPASSDPEVPKLGPMDEFNAREEEIERSQMDAAPGFSQELLAVKAGPVRRLLNHALTSRYVQARVADCGIDPNADRFYDPGYRAALRQMVAHVIAVEGPLYRGQLVTRIARAHGFQRNGPHIEKCVCDAIERRFPATMEEDGKIVYWPEGSAPGSLVPFRVSEKQERDVASIPMLELASLARTFLMLGVDDETVMQKMKDHFELGRLREATRNRLGACINFAKDGLAEFAAQKDAEAL